ncbi:DUF5665 domain-containing protein [Antarctobacter sp.]|uniref:DUF5665 domain-containing protein n=1 Tax=Antarctobacter sp. TaxID=1872577 RepID=UPI002B266EE5|nr:DUF5665 domain-containing protein [Antarctobacter sp.]
MSPEPNDDDLRQEVARLADEVARLNGHRYVRIHNNVARLMMFQFLRGLMLGLGTAVGATALVSVAVLVLSQIEFIPILGDLATALIKEIKVEVTE